VAKPEALILLSSSGKLNRIDLPSMSDSLLIPGFRDSTPESGGSPCHSSEIEFWESEPKV
jgi:hypothetical protein